MAVMPRFNHICMVILVLSYFQVFNSIHGSGLVFLCFYEVFVASAYNCSPPVNCKYHLFPQLNLPWGTWWGWGVKHSKHPVGVNYFFSMSTMDW